MKFFCLAFCLMATLSKATEPTANQNAPAPPDAPVLKPAEESTAPELASPVSIAEDETFSRHAKLLGIASAGVAVGTAGALVSWFDREGTWGRVSAITVGALGAAMFAAAVGGLVAALIDADRPVVGNAIERASAWLFTGLAVILVGLITGFVGLAVGAVASTLLSEPSGTQRGVVGLAGGGTLVAASIAMVAFAW
jgi:hypothetical protein